MPYRIRLFISAFLLPVSFWQHIWYWEGYLCFVLFDRLQEQIILPYFVRSFMQQSLCGYTQSLQDLVRVEAVSYSVSSRGNGVPCPVLWPGVVRIRWGCPWGARSAASPRGSTPCSTAGRSAWEAGSSPQKVPPCMTLNLTQRSKCNRKCPDGGFV